MIRELCRNLGDAQATEQLSKMMHNLQFKDVNIINNKNKNINLNINGLPSWHNVMTPPPDITAGRYKNAEFAADLSQVADGKGSIEYLDPVEFFKRTFITQGLKGLLVKSLMRLSGQGGEPVLQLKTAFGGGKTHSMLALYHLMRGRFNIENLPKLKEIMNAAGLSSMPKVNVAVFDGTKYSPAVTNKLEGLPEIEFNTVWGCLTAQLALNANNLELYEYIRKSDESGIAPGKDILKKIFDACGSCLILLDELVAYALKLPNDELDEKKLEEYCC